MESKTVLHVLLFALVALVSPALTSAADFLWTQDSTDLPSWMEHQVIYEINVRQYSEAGTFAAVEADLDRIEGMGFTTLWFMPIHPIGEVNRKGSLGSYYSIADYRSVNTEFGDKEDFRSLVQAAQGRGLRVIMDWVGNHTAWDHVWAQSRPEFYMKDQTGTYIPPLGFDWTDVIQIDFNNPEVLEAHIEAMRYWVEEFGIDGFRCDYATGVPTEFWDELSTALLRIRPDLFLLAESDVADHQLSAFHASYGWEMMHAFEAIAQGREPANHIDAVLARQDLKFPRGYDLVYMTSNHDENSWQGTVFERLGGGVETFAVLSYTLDGIPLVYNGQEAGLDKRLEFFERDPIEWRAHPLERFYRSLNRLKRHHPALGTDAASHRLRTNMDEHVYAFMRGEEGGPEILVVANLTAKDRLGLAVGDQRIAGGWDDLFSGEPVDLEETWQLDLRSWDYRVLVRD